MLEVDIVTSVMLSKVRARYKRELFSRSKRFDFVGRFV